MRDHQRFWVELTGKLGPPICAATLVGCLLEGRIEGIHVLLVAVGVGLIAVSHWYSHHREE